MKKILFTCIFVSFVLYSCFNPSMVIEASKNGILIWFHQILPTLLPFTILSSILLKSKFLDSFKGNSNIIAIFITMVCGFAFGFPIGAKLSADFHKNKLLTRNQATLLAITTNNFSPMYVCGFVLPLVFGTNQYHTATYLLMYLFPLILATTYLIITYARECQEIQNTDANSAPSSNFRLNMQIFDESIISGFESLIKICGYIVFFSCFSMIISKLWVNPPLIWNILLAQLEITNGIRLISSIDFASNIAYICTIQIVSFGGLSGLAQTASLLETSGLSIYKYIIGKVALSLLLTLLSVIYVFLFV